eukprot:snap_masked-scaffold1228_size54408-processed-gene-0.6 protein:Tk00482 transcript:snap_masked-scaffold1228_size54408-processed-gene-0.6-mRNA-1 annotation:"hypothetical protein DAPPUDRAFT_269522"
MHFVSTDSISSATGASHYGQIPFEDVAVDLFALAGKCFLVYVDRLSFWFEVAFFNSDPSSAQVIKKMMPWFSTFGIPVRLRADNGPQFRPAEFSAFLAEHGVAISLSSPYNPRSNGLAESAVKTCKSLLSKTLPMADCHSQSFLTGLLEQHNTQCESGKSPSEVVFGRLTRSWVPVAPGLLSRPDLPAITKAKTRVSVEQKRYYDRSTVGLSPISPNSPVIVRDNSSGT